MTTKDWQAEVEAAAEAKREEIFKRNPNGFTVAPYVNGDIIESIFEEAASWAREKLENKGQLEAEKAVENIRRTQDLNKKIDELGCGIKFEEETMTDTNSNVVTIPCSELAALKRELEAMKAERDEARKISSELDSALEQFRLKADLDEDKIRTIEAERDELKELVDEVYSHHSDKQSIWYIESWMERARKALGDK